MGSLLHCQHHTLLFVLLSLSPGWTPSSTNSTCYDEKCESGGNVQQQDLYLHRPGKHQFFHSSRPSTNPQRHCGPRQWQFCSFATTIPRVLVLNNPEWRWPVSYLHKNGRAHMNIRVYESYSGLCRHTFAGYLFNKLHGFMGGYMWEQNRNWDNKSGYTLRCLAQDLTFCYHLFFVLATNLDYLCS